VTVSTELVTGSHPTGSATRRGYFLGTPFCGSTVFGQALGVHPAVTYLGEVDRLVGFPPSVWAEEPVATCHYCELHDQPCPVWTPERVGTARELPYGRLMSYFEAELRTPVLVDGSKHPGWMRAVLADRPADLDDAVVFLTVRSPFAFADSYRFRTGCEVWQAANVWRDVYYDALRLATRESLPLMVVRYEQFALDPEPVLRRAGTMLGIEYVPEMRHFQEQPRHDVGGNYNVLAVKREKPEEFSPTEFRDRLPDQWVRSTGQSNVYWGKPFGGWVDDKWQRNMVEGDVETVLQTPGLTDVANVLGYELSREAMAWQQRRSVTD